MDGGQLVACSLAFPPERWGLRQDWSGGREDAERGRHDGGSGDGGHGEGSRRNEGGGGEPACVREAAERGRRSRSLGVWVSPRGSGSVTLRSVAPRRDMGTRHRSRDIDQGDI